MKRPPGQDPEPAQLRAIFGNNLRALSDDYPSVAGLCRDLGINRTQFNRYLSGESFPRPDVLHRICDFFGTDARILLEPAGSIRAGAFDLLNHPVVSGFFGSGPIEVPDALFPSGIYRFVRRSFIDELKFVMGLVRVYRADGYTFLRGFEPRAALRLQGLSTALHDREYRGIVMRQDEGVMIIAAHRNSLACSFNFLAQETSFQQNLWEGYVTRTVRERVNGVRASRMVYEHIGQDMTTVIGAARTTGLVDIGDVPPFQARLLRENEPFR